MQVGFFFWPYSPELCERLAERADRYGYAMIGIADTPGNAMDPWISAAIVARSCRRARVALCVTNLLTRHPAVSAAAIASLDLLSHGRALLGIGAGHSGTKNVGLAKSRADELADGVTFIKTLLRGEPGNFRGANAHLPWIKRAPPVFLAASHPKPLQAAGRTADGVFVNYGLAADNIRESRVHLAAGEMHARFADIVSGEPVIDEHAVGGSPGRLQRLGMGGGEKHRRRALDPRQMRVRAAKVSRLAAQQRLDEGDAVRELVGARFRKAHVLGAAVAGADPEQRAPVREEIERGDRGRADGGMTGQQIGHAERNARAAAAARHDCRRDPRVHGVSRRVGDADHGVAVAVGALGEPLAKLRRVRPKEETNLHSPSACNERPKSART